MYMVWLDLHAKSALNTGTPSVEAHKCAVKERKNHLSKSQVGQDERERSSLLFTFEGKKHETSYLLFGLIIYWHCMPFRNNMDPI